MTLKKQLLELTQNDSQERILNIPISNRLTGVDLMLQLLNHANINSLSVMLIGGGPKIADKVVECQKDNFPEVKFISMSGINDIHQPQKKELDDIFSIVATSRPHILFVAFGSPFQEQWLYQHRKELKGIVCVGVGGAFNFLSNNLPRPPWPIRKMGFEWLWR